PVLEAPLGVVAHEDLLRHRDACAGDDHSRRAVDRARGDAGEPLVQPRRVTDQRPHVIGRAADPPLVAHRAEHRADPQAISAAAPANWALYRLAYAPPAASSDSWSPCSTISPSFITRIVSAS